MTKEFTREAVIEMRESGMPWKAIGEHFGVHRSTVQKRAAQLGLPYGAIKAKRRAGEADALRVLLDQGYTDEGIARHFGISVSNAAKRRLRAGVLRGPSNANARPKTPEELAHLESLLDDGLSFKAIRQMTGVNHATLARHFPGRHYTPEQTIEAMSLSKRAYWLYKKLEKKA